MSDSTFALTDVQREFRQTMRAFCEEKVAPHAAEVDRNAEFPWQSFEACKEMELPALGIPEAYGGAGADTVTQAIAVEELARVCASTSLTILISKLGMIPVMNWGSEELKRTYMPRVASGEIQASYCLSEADAGSDVAAMRARAVRDGDDYILTGSKYWITNAGISDVYIVFAKTDPDGGSRGISLLPRREGVGHPHRQARGQARHAGQPDRRGRPRRGAGAGARTASAKRARASPSPCTRSTAAAPPSARKRSASRRARSTTPPAYMKQRQAFGGPIADLQGLRFMLADMAMRNEAARALVYRACAMVDNDPAGELTKFGAMAKAFASDAAMSITVDAVQLLGGYGYTKDFPVERYLRDAKVTQIYEGTNQVQRVVIAREVLKHV